MTGVEAGSEWERVGVKVGDRIAAVNDRRFDSIAEYHELMGRQDQEIKITMVRGRKRYALRMAVK